MDTYIATLMFDELMTFLSHDDMKKFKIAFPTFAQGFSTTALTKLLDKAIPS